MSSKDHRNLIKRSKFNRPERFILNIFHIQLRPLRITIQVQI